MDDNLHWVPIPGTEERSILNIHTGEVLHFTDEVIAPEEEYPPMGLDDMLDPNYYESHSRGY